MKPRSLTDRLDPGVTADRVEPWIREILSRYMPPLEFSEIRQGARALSSLYVERRHRSHLSKRSVEGEGKRAAFASYYAPLHFLTVYGTLLEAFDRTVGDPPPTRLFDGGCGTGACGVAWAVAAENCFGRAPRLTAFDRSGWALSEARRTRRHFGIRGRTRAGSLPQHLPHLKRGDAVILGWVVNELADEERERLLVRLIESRRRGALIYLFEPLAGRLSPWWEGWQRRLEPEGMGSAIVKFEIARPDWVWKLDEATGLDHRQVGARVLLPKAGGES